MFLKIIFEINNRASSPIHKGNVPAQTTFYGIILFNKNYIKHVTMNVQHLRQRHTMRQF